VTHRIVDIEEPIPKKTTYRDNASLEVGKTRVVGEGMDGVQMSRYIVTIVDGEEDARQLVKSDTIIEPISKVIEQGKAGKTVSIGGKSVKYKQKIENVRCTAYDKSYICTGKNPGDPGYGVTKSGLEAREGIVAVDPKVIPLGSKLYIEILEEGVPDYGYAIAGDTGGLIRGKKVDLYFDWSLEKLREFGVKTANVYILSDD
jgi:3D (Asp-Asp-Asp) domain-containing protein